MKKTFSRSWNASRQKRKQRKYRKNAPLHILRKFIGCHLSKELRVKHSARGIGLRKNDKIKVIAGIYKGKAGKVDAVDVKKTTAAITGIESTKKDGSKASIPVQISNMIIIELDTSDKRRMKSLERKKKRTITKLGEGAKK